MVISLASYGFVGGAMGNLLAQWEASGIFSYVLPFLLIFALVFGLLMRLGLFSTKEGDPNRTINAIIALSISLMSLQFDFVSMFFAELFPRFGIALAIILVILIGAGLFLPKSNKGFNWGLIVVIVGIVLWVIIGSVSSFSMGGGGGVGYWIMNILNAYWPIIVFIILFIVVVSSFKKKDDSKNNPDNMWMDILSGARK